MAANPDESDASLFFPLILGIASSSPARDSRSNSDQESDERRLERIVIINPITQGMIVIESSRSLESLLLDAVSKQGLPPASKGSIEAMPKVEITQEDLGKECSICLDGWEIGGEAREMPCKHKYHSGCIEKWLGMHGSCPICRFEMPIDDEERRKRGNSDGEGGDVDDEGRGRRAERGEIWVSLSFSDGGNRDSTASTTTATESSSDSSPDAAR